MPATLTAEHPAETADRRRQAIESLQRSLETLEHEDDPDLLEHISGWVDNPTWDIPHERSRSDLLRQIADEESDRQQPANPP